MHNGNGIDLIRIQRLLVHDMGNDPCRQVVSVRW